MNRYIEGITKYSLPHPFRAEAERLANQFDTNTYKQDGVIRWRSNNSVPPEEVLEFWKYIGKRFNMSKAVAARKRECKEILNKYRILNDHINEERMHEIRAAFGPGVDVVDVITGKRTRT